MKKNGNDKNLGTYYLGLDVGTNSVGWAVTDKEYNLLKCKGNAMWGARLFDEAQDASARRTSRTNRRRLARRKQRLLLLELLFTEEIKKIDPDFFLRMAESAYWADDKTNKNCHFALFNDPNFTDKDYYRRYPTIYHLRAELAADKKPHDIRLVYLALHHILKSRGHFLYESSAQNDQIRNLNDVLTDLDAYLNAEFDLSLNLKEPELFADALQQEGLGIRKKEELLHTAWGGEKTGDETDELSITALLDLLAGAKVKLSSLFRDETLSDAEPGSITLKSDLDEQFDALSTSLGDRIDLILLLKDVYDTARLSQMLKGHTLISEAKVDQYNRNYKDLRTFKAFVRKSYPQKYKEIFTLKKDKLNNYAAYSGYRNRSGDFRCTQEDFCKYLSKTVSLPEDADENLKRIFREIKEGSFLPRLKGSDNGVIPYQLHRQELSRILENASGYLPFLTLSDEDGNTVKDKIIKIFEFRIPYYVGPLNKKAGAYWAVRFPGKENDKIYPWNFEKTIDTEASSVRFIENLIGRCTYTGDYVLPKDSLLYSEYMLLNELNPLQINNQPIKPEIKQAIIRDLFEASRKRVTKKKIYNYLLSQGYIQGTDVITGIDDTVKTELRSYHDFRHILEKTSDRQMVDEIIRHLLIFGDDRFMLKKWLRKNTHGLNEEDLSMICRLKYKDWGRLSESFLTKIQSVDPHEGTGEAHSIMEMLRSTNKNLMQLLSSDYQYAENAEAYRKELFGTDQTLTERLNSLYIAPAVRRSIRQTLRIVDEIVDIRKSVPEKIFIEMARDSSKEMKGKRTESRKAKLLALYNNCREESAALLNQLNQEDDNTLRSDKLYLYYTQFGKCMYSGEPIDLQALMNGQGFDIDHIFPQSRIKDNSLENRVVVKNTLNREKTNIYPIKADIRQKMRPYWEMLKECGMIGEKKYQRLIRSTPLTEDELSSFVARQLTETQQSTKALTVLFKELYGDATRIVFSKAGNVSDFRHDFDIIKCREVNDFHHAKDAYLNIVVGNVYDTKFTKRFFANIRNEEYSLNQVFARDVSGAWDKDETIKTVKKAISKNNPIITRMPREAKGKIFDLNPVSRNNNPKIPRKETLSVERYGGYTGRYAAFFFVAEHRKGKKRIRTIEPVYIYGKELYSNDPVQYCESVLKLENPSIITPIIRFDSLLEINGHRLYLTGGSDSNGDGRDIYDLSAQLCIDYEREQYIRDIFKFTDRAEAQRTDLVPTKWDHISEEKNIDLFDWFCSKLDTNVYKELFDSERLLLLNNKDSFKQLTLCAQCRILKQIVFMLQCNAVIPNYSELCGKKGGSRIRKNCNISTFNTAFMIHQSVTGLFEIKEDLLH